MTSQTVPETPAFVQDLHDAAFQQAVVQAAALMDRPEYNGRLQKAMDFVLAGKVTLHEDGTATVKSGAHTYEIAPECTCQDSQQRNKWCKHYLAVQLLKRTYECMHRPVKSHTPQPPQAPAWQCAQAPSSCTLKWSVGGIELLLTLRDATDDALFSRIKRVLPRIEAKVEAQRQQRHETHGPADADAAFCPIHQVAMTRSKDGKGWYHKAGEKPDGKAIWCRGK